VLVNQFLEVDSLHSVIMFCADMLAPLGELLSADEGTHNTKKCRDCGKSGGVEMRHQVFDPRSGYHMEDGTGRPGQNCRNRR
jgi:hypothetical protein